jgi:hypothetical protein
MCTFGASNSEWCMWNLLLIQVHSVAIILYLLVSCPKESFTTTESRWLMVGSFEELILDPLLLIFPQFLDHNLKAIAYLDGSVSLIQGLWAFENAWS